MKVAIVPYAPENPYQPLLKEALEKRGHEVVPASSLISLTQSSADDLDIIHLHWPPVLSLSPLVLARLAKFLWRLKKFRNKGARIVWTIHNLTSHETNWKYPEILFSRCIARLSDQIICHSNYSQTRVVDLYRIDEKKTSVIPHGNYSSCYPNTVTQREARERLSIPTQKTVFCCLGLIRPYKGVRELLRLIVDSPDLDAIFLIAGKPSGGISEEELISLAKDDPRIHLHLERIPDESLQLYFNASDAVLFPYLKSLTSGAAILAMSFSKACIGYKSDGIESILDERGASLVPTGDIKNLKRKIVEAIANPNKLASKGHYNFQKSENWNWNHVAALTENCYHTARRMK